MLRFRSGASCARFVSRLALACAALAALPTPRVAAGDPALRVNDREYLEARGLNVLVFSSEYNGMFFDEKTAGIELIHHGVRTATGGAVRLTPTPEQWDQIPKLVSRKIDREHGSIEALLRYADFEFDARVVVQAEGEGFRISVFVDRPVPERLEGRAGLNLEFLPSAYFEKTYLADGGARIFPRYPSGPSLVRPADTQIRQFEGYRTFDGWGRKEYLETRPFATAKSFVLAPEDPERRVAITSVMGDLQLHDGRTVAQNGWFVVRSLLATKTSGKVADWYVEPHRVPEWTRPPVIQYSQVGYHPAQQKVAVIELDAHDTPLDTASIVELTAGTPADRIQVPVRPWGPYLRYRYATIDFSEIRAPGVYAIQYGNQRTAVFPIGPEVYDGIWHLTSDVWFPVQMDHMRVNEAYRVWHALPHMDDARQAPVNVRHFDAYQMGPTTETKYQPGERIPGLAVGGWFDAGDFDIQTLSHAGAILHFVDTWEQFKPERDETFIDQTTRYVDLHRPDGKPDLRQQIEHGALQVAAQYKAFGRAIRGIVDPHLFQYTHLGDGGSQTDGLVYDPSLDRFESDGKRSGLDDDRWAFTGRVPATNYTSIGSLAAASRALKGFNDALANECLALATKAYADEKAYSSTHAPGTDFESRFATGAELTAVLQLFATTRDAAYGQRFQELVWPALDRAAEFTIATAVKAIPYFDPAYKERLRPAVEKHRARLDALAAQNPYGVPIGTGGWAGNSGVISWALTNYQLHRAFPDVIGPEYVHRGLQYVLGRHPYSNLSFVSAVGVQPKRLAYGSNRADFSFIAGGVVPGALVLKPDFPENKDDWPFLWGENEYTVDIGANYILLAHAVRDLVR
jgi:hypothetical protein